MTLRSPGLAPPSGTPFRGTRTGTSAVASLVTTCACCKTAKAVVINDDRSARAEICDVGC